MKTTIKNTFISSIFVVIVSGMIFAQTPDSSESTDTGGGTSAERGTAKVTTVIPDPAAKEDHSSRSASKSAGDSDLHYEITPYGWLSGIRGDLRVRNTSVHVASSGFDTLSSVDFAFGVRAEFSKGRLGGFIDENYANLGQSGNLNGPLATSYDVQPVMNILELGPSYVVYFKPGKSSSDPDSFSFEALGGMRWTHIGLTLTAGNLSSSGSRNPVDFFGGGRLKFRPSPKWTISTRDTIGGGGSKPAWTWNALVDYRFHRGISVNGGYQVLHMNADNGVDRDLVGFKGRLQGLIFGLSFLK